MADQIHGHEVIHMMTAAGKHYTRETLRADIEARFGADARFCTCSAQDLTADGLITFLEGRGKFATHADGFSMIPGKTCGG